MANGGIEGRTEKCSTSESIILVCDDGWYGTYDVELDKILSDGKHELVRLEKNALVLNQGSKFDLGRLRPGNYRVLILNPCFERKHTVEDRKDWLKLKVS